MDISEQSHAAIASVLEEALKRYASAGEESVLTDIHLLPNQDSGELIILDDDINLDRDDRKILHCTNSRVYGKICYRNIFSGDIHRSIRSVCHIDFPP